MFPVRSLAMLLMAAFASHATAVPAGPQQPLDLGLT
jgi:hypothetical protein